LKAVWDELRVEDHGTRLRALLSSRKTGLRAGRRNARPLAEVLRREGRVTAGPFPGRKDEANNLGIGVGLYRKILIQQEKSDLLAGTSTPAWTIQSRSTADLATEGPKGVKNL